MNATRKRLRPLRVLLADDHILMRAQTRALLEASPLVEVIAEVSDGPTAVAEAQRLCPDLVILDFSLPCLNGLHTAAAIRHVCPKARVILVSMYDEPSYADRAFTFGAAAFLTKRYLDASLVPTVERMFANLHSPGGSTGDFVLAGQTTVEPHTGSPLPNLLPRLLDLQKSPALAWLGKLWKHTRSLGRAGTR